MQEEIEKLKAQLATARVQRNVFEEANVRANQKLGKFYQWLYTEIENARKSNSTELDGLVAVKRFLKKFK